MPFPSDLEIARGAELRPLNDIASEAGIPTDCLEPYGEGAAKIKLDAIGRMADRPKALPTSKNVPASTTESMIERIR